jgi:DNA-binding transcriptional regulator YiaG
MNAVHQLEQSVYLQTNIDLELSAMNVEPKLTAALLKQARAFAGWSQRELAKRAGLQESSVKYWESKTGVIGGVEVKLMLTVLTAELMSDEQPTTTPDQRCGARTRKGTPCKCKALPGKQRCKFHGGMSTGPKTAEGRARIAEAPRRRWAEYRKVA